MSLEWPTITEGVTKATKAVFDDIFAAVEEGDANERARAVAAEANKADLEGDYLKASELPPSVVSSSPLYIGTYFRSTVPFNTSEQLYLQASPDGKNWKPLCGPLPWFSGEISARNSFLKGIANPAGSWLLVYQSNPNGTTFTVAGINLETGSFATPTLIAHPSVAGIGAVEHTWTVSPFLDSSGVFHAIVTVLVGGKGQHYELHPTNAGWTTWSEPVKLTELRANAIDGRIIQVGSTLHLFFKNEATKYVEHATCPAAEGVTGTWTLKGEGNWAGWGEGIEGPDIEEVLPGVWQISFDKYPSSGVTGPQSAVYSRTSVATLESGWSALAEWVGNPHTMRAPSFSKVTTATDKTAIQAASYANVEAVPGCILWKKAAQGVANNSVKLVVFDEALEDNDGMSATGSSAQININTPGRYIVTLNVEWATNAVGIRYATIQQNGSAKADSQVSAASESVTIQSLAATIRCARGDSIRAEVKQTSGAELNLGSNSPKDVPRLAATWIGP